MTAPTTTRTERRTGIHPAWWVAVVAFLALVGAAGFRAAPGVLMVPLEEEFGWPRTLMSSAVSVNLILYGLMAPFAAALMDRFGIRQVTSVALLLVAAGSGLTIFVTQGWQLMLTWGLLIGLGTGSMAMVFAATIANRWFVRPPRAGHRHPDRGGRRRSADLPAGDGQPGRRHRPGAPPRSRSPSPRSPSCRS